MHFKLIYGNHSHHGIQMGDTLLMLRYGLEATGHTADIEHDFQPGCTNVCMEMFTDAYMEIMEKNWAPNTRLIVIATEFLTGEAFNDFYDEPKEQREPKDHYHNRSVWRGRYDNFIKLLPKISAIWHLSHYQAEAFAKAFPETPVGFLPHGYTQAFPTVKHRPDDEKDIDVLFTGTVTSYRKGIIQALRDEGLNVDVNPVFTPPFHREDAVARSKLAINLKQHPDWKYESNSRLFYHISNDSLILTEPCTYPSDIHPYVMVSGDSMVDDIRAILAEGNFTERAKSVREKFARERDMRDLLPDLLKQSDLS